MTEEFDFDSGIPNPDHRENLIEAIRLQAKQQGIQAHVYCHGDTLKVVLDGTDRGKILAYAAAINSWARRQNA